MSMLVPDIFVEDAVAPAPKRRRLDVAAKDRCSVETVAFCFDSEVVAEPQTSPDNAAVSGDILEDTIVCFGMVGQV